MTFEEEEERMADRDVPLSTAASVYPQPENAWSESKFNLQGYGLEM